MGDVRSAGGPPEVVRDARLEGLVPAVTRAAAILGAGPAAAAHPRPPPARPPQRGLPKSSTANLCQALEAERMITRRDGGYALGRRLVELGGAYLSSVDQIRQFYDACREQPHLSRQAARVAVLDGTDVLYLARFDGTQPIRLTANIGDRFPAHCTATGKTLLALLPQAVLDERLRGQVRLVQLTERSIADPGALRAELVRVRDLGYAVDDEETTPGVTCVAIAMPGARTDSDPFAVSVTVMTSQFTPELRAILLAELHTVAASMSNPLLDPSLGR